MKKQFFYLLVVVAFLLSACGQAATATTAPQTNPATQAPAVPTNTESSASETVNLSYAMWDSSQLPATEQLISAFEAKNPNITITPEVVPWDQYWNKLQTAVAGGEAYDVFWMNIPYFQQYAAKNVLMNLQPLIQDGNYDMSVYYPALVNSYTYQNNVYGIPRDYDTVALFYNKDLFDAAGVAYPTDQWTWKDLTEAAKKLTTADTWGFASAFSDRPGYWDFIYSNGGDVNTQDGKVILDQPAACDAIKYYYSFIQDGTSPDGPTLLASDPFETLFPNGKVAMMAYGSWGAGALAQISTAHFDVAPMPIGTVRGSSMHGLANVAWSGTKHPEAAWEFLKFLGSQDAAKILANTGTVIPAYKGMESAWVSAIPSMNLQVFVDAASYAKPWPAVLLGTEWESKIQDVFREVWQGNRPMDDQACAQATADANAVLGK
jgi:multiple sugar transport system substrate-binding protein